MRAFRRRHDRRRGPAATAGLPLDVRIPATALQDWAQAHGCTAGQAKAIIALVCAATVPTYAMAAGELGISVNTLRTHLRRVRLTNPDVWRVVKALRESQLSARHTQAVKRAQAHTDRYFRLRFYHEYGYWPKEHGNRQNKP